MTVASLAAGGICVVAILPSEPTDMLLAEQQLDDGQLSVLLDGKRQIVVSLRESNGNADSVCEEIINYNAGFNPVFVSWSESKIQMIVVSGDIIYPRSTNYVENGYDKSAYASAARDFSGESLKARNKRKHKLHNFVRDPKRIPGGQDYVFSALGAEVVQLEDLISSVTGGSVSHVLGIMARVRLCTIGKPLGLLQLCAAFMDAKLNVYTAAQAGSRPSLTSAAEISFDISPEPTPILHNQLDFDAWLDLNGLFYRGRSYPHREIIREIGNTVASHLDIDIQPSVYFLRSGSTKIEVKLDYLSFYSIKVATTVLYLAKGLLRLR